MADGVLTGTSTVVSVLLGMQLTILAQSRNDICDCVWIPAHVNQY